MDATASGSGNLAGISVANIRDLLAGSRRFDLRSHFQDMAGRNLEVVVGKAAERGLVASSKTKNPGMKPGPEKPQRTSGHDDRIPFSMRFLKKV
jgi:hypothetical protein